MPPSSDESLENVLSLLVESSSDSSHSDFRASAGFCDFSEKRVAVSTQLYLHGETGRV